MSIRTTSCEIGTNSSCICITVVSKCNRYIIVDLISGARAPEPPVNELLPPSQTMSSQQISFTLKHQERGLPHVHVLIFNDNITVGLI